MNRSIENSIFRKPAVVLTAILVAALSFIARPEVALAAGAQHGGPPPGIDSLLWPTLNFILYVLLILTVYKKKLAPMLKMRARTIAERLQKASSVLADADTELARQQLRLEQIAEEQTGILESFRLEGRNTAAEVLKNAERSAEAIRHDVVRRINREVQQAKAEIRGDVVRLATDRARGQLETKISNEDDRRLRQEALQALL